MIKRLLEKLNLIKPHKPKSVTSDVIRSVCDHPIGDRENFFNGAICYCYKCKSCNEIIRNYNIKYPYDAKVVKSDL